MERSLELWVAKVLFDMVGREDCDFRIKGAKGRVDPPYGRMELGDATVAQLPCMQPVKEFLRWLPMNKLRFSWLPIFDSSIG